jgi:CheY-like chemotaxis protein
MHNLKMLVVDDDDITHLILANSLKEVKNFTFTTTHVCSGKEALELLSSEKQDFDLVILDIEMPIIDGWEVANYIRNTLQSNLFLIAHTNISFNNKFLEKGFDAYLRKNFFIPGLEELLEEKFVNVSI